MSAAASMRVRQRFGKREPRGDAMRRAIGQRGDLLLILRIAGAQDHPLSVRGACAHSCMTGMNQVDPLLLDEAADERHQRRLRFEREAAALA